MTLFERIFSTGTCGVWPHDSHDESHHQVCRLFHDITIIKNEANIVYMILSLDDRPSTAADQSIRVLPLP